MKPDDPRLKPRPCLYCGGTFKPKRWWAKYCKKECRASDWDQKHPRLQLETKLN